MNSTDMSCETKLKLILDSADFEACRSQWNELVGSRLFHRWEWMFHWWENFGSGSQLAIVVVTDAAGQWIGIAPWYKTFSASRGHVIRQLASGAACSDYTSIAVREGCENEVAEALSELMTHPSEQPLFRDVDLYEFEGHTECDKVIASLSHRLQTDGARVLDEEISATWEAELAETWDAFEQRISKSFRRKTRKASGRLQSDEVTARVATSTEDIVRDWTSFVDLHQRRRNSLNEPGCFADCHFEKFLRDATASLSEFGHAQINTTLLNDKPIAANLEFTCGDGVFMYQTGLDPEFASFEPGHLIFTWAIQSAIERGFRTFDFLRGDEPYKARWNAVRVPIMRTRIVPNRITSRLRNGIWNAGRTVRNWTRAKQIVSAEAGGEPINVSTPQAGSL